MDELETRYSVTISSEDHTNFVLQKLRTSSHFRVSKLAISGVSLESLHVQLVVQKVWSTLNLLKLETCFKVSESLLFQIVSKLPNLTSLSVTYVYPPSSTGTKSGQDGASSNEDRSFKFPFFADRWITNFSTLGKNKLQQGSASCSNNYESNINMLTTFGEDNSVMLPHENIRFLQLDLGQNVTFQLSKIFHIFPCLIELVIANVRDEPLKHFKTLPLASTSSSSPSPPHHHYSEHHLKRLSVRQYSTASFSEKLLQTLMRLNMHLEKLELIFHPPPASSSSTSTQSVDTLQTSRSLLRQFIESQDASLQSLKLIQVENDLCHSPSSSPATNNNFTRTTTGNSNGSPVVANNYYWNFNYSSPSYSISLLPLSLSNLEVLHVQKPLISNLAQVLNHFPKLKELSLQVSYGSNWQGLLPSRLEPHESITKLKIDFIDSDSFSRIGYCFPSLQTLQLAFCDQSLFNVLCDLIPYFNGNNGGSRGSLVSCQQCHGSSQEFIVRKKNKNDDESFPRGAGVLSNLAANFPSGNHGHNLELTFRNSNHDSDSKSRKDSNTPLTSSLLCGCVNNLGALHPDYLKQQLRKKYLFKSKSRLSILFTYQSVFAQYNLYVTYNQ